MDDLKFKTISLVEVARKVNLAQFDVFMDGVPLFT